MANLPRELDRSAAGPAWTEAEEEELPPTDLQHLFRTFDAAAGFVALVGVLSGATAASSFTIGAPLSFRFSLLEVLLLGGGCLLWTQLLHLLGLHEPVSPLTRRQVVLPIGMAGAIGGAMITAALVLSGSGPLKAIVLGSAFPGLAVPAAVGIRLLAAALQSRGVRRRPPATVIIGSGPMAVAAARRVRRRGGDDSVLGFFDEAAVDLPESGERWLGRIDALEKFLMWHAVDDVVIALPVKSFYEEIQEVMGVCEKAGISCRHSAHFFSRGLARLRVEPNATIALIPAPDDARLMVKRAIDILVSAAALLILSPLMAACAIAIRISSPGPVFFIQERYGYRKRKFRMYKFRTMDPDAQHRQQGLECLNESQGATFKIRNDPRVTPVGRFLRRTSIDEIPQLLNVLRGEMSLVGPRPLPVRDVHNFEDARLMRRFSVAPGITGLWQVSGRSNLTFWDWMGLDLQYVDRWSLALDWSILARTLPAVMKGDGAV